MTARYVPDFDSERFESDRPFAERPARGNPNYLAAAVVEQMIHRGDKVDFRHADHPGFVFH